ncbi:AbiV family abortive infection protein [Nonomuraea wenchangensis]|uniref:AbiV family abortive infection protein n=1 Tax=Nonomuraea wenchangensis TaxID=568860 RepID=UPI00332D2329
MDVIYSDEQLAGLADAALANARSLASSARLLLASGTAGLARSLAILAMEEAGKSLIAKRAIEASGDERRELEQLLKEALYKHPPKLEQVQKIFELLTSMVQLLKAFVVKSDEELGDGWTAQGFNLAKQDGFYVGLKQDAVTTPSEITAAEAEPVLVRAEVAIEAVAALVGQVFIVELG